MEDFGSWSVLTTNFLLVLFMGMGGVTLSAVLQLTNAKWRFQVRRMACSMVILLPIALVMLVILLLNGESTFQWLGHAHDGTFEHLAGWHNYTFLVLREILGFFVMSGMYLLFIKYQHESEVDESYRAQRRLRNMALLIPFVYFLYATMVAWDFEMTMFPGWHSSIYAPYFFQSNFSAFLALFTLLLLYFGPRDKTTKPVDDKLYNYMAQFMLAMTILWTYFYFSQYLIMWYGRLPVDVTRYHHMMEGMAGLWWTFLALKFIIPFCTLVIKFNRHNPTVIGMVATSILLGTWIERYTWISGSVDPEFYHVPMSAGFDWLVTFGTLAVCMFAVTFSFRKFNIIKA